MSTNDFSDFETGPAAAPSRRRVLAGMGLAGGAALALAGPAGLAQAAPDFKFLLAGTTKSPDEFPGKTDHDKLQAALNAAVDPESGFFTIIIDREYNLTGTPPLLIEKKPWYDRREVVLLGTGGVLRKDDAGAIFSSSTPNTGDIRTLHLKYQSKNEAGTVVWDANKLLRVFSSGCDYRHVDRIVKQDDPKRWVQSMKFHHEHIVGGWGPAFEWMESFDCALTYSLIEDRPAAIWNLTPPTVRFQNRNLRLVGNVMENMRGIALKLGSSWSTHILDNYFEQNGESFDAYDGTPAHIDLYTVQKNFFHTGLTLQGNMFSQRATQKKAKTVCVLLGPNYGAPINLSSNIADGAILYKMAEYAKTWAKTDNTDYVEAGDVIFRGQEDHFIGSTPKVGSTAARPNVPVIGGDGMYFDTTLGKPIWPAARGTAAKALVTITAGATKAGKITLSIGGTTHLIDVAAGDSATAVRDKIVAAVGAMYPWRATAGSGATVNLESVSPGDLTSPTLNGGTTGVTGTISVVSVGSDPVWVDATGARV